MNLETDNCSHIERWFDEDLEATLIAGDIPVTPENITRLRTACEGIFEDKTVRNEMLADKAAELFEKDVK